MDLTPFLFGGCLACFILKKSSTTPSSDCSPRGLFQEWKKQLTLIHPDSCPSSSAKLPPISLHPPVIIFSAIRHHRTSVPALLVSHALSSDRLPGHQDPILLDLLRARFIAKMYWEALHRVVSSLVSPHTHRGPPSWPSRRGARDLSSALAAQSALRRTFTIGVEQSSENSQGAHTSCEGSLSGNYLEKKIRYIGFRGWKWGCRRFRSTCSPASARRPACRPAVRGRRWELPPFNWRMPTCGTGSRVSPMRWLSPRMAGECSPWLR